jgi:hypothetical protein
MRTLSIASSALSAPSKTYICGSENKGKNKWHCVTKGAYFSDPVGNTTLGSGQQHNTLPNAANSEVLVLFTLLVDMLTAATAIALSWVLSPDDVNINLMPLFHVGGIA